jgi:hypothetical protein
MTINNTGSETAATREIPVTTSSDAPAPEKRFAPYSGFIIEDRPLDDYEKLRVSIANSTCTDSRACFSNISLGRSYR